jgi:hypothetical protein
MKNLEEKFKGLTLSKNKRKSHVNLVEKEHVKQLGSNFEFNITNVENVIEIHLVETSNVYALKKADHRLGFFQNPEVLVSSSNKKELDNLWVLHLSATQNVTRNPNIIFGLKFVVAAPMITTEVKFILLQEKEVCV